VENGDEGEEVKEEERRPFKRSQEEKDVNKVR
jgi:hypothetical protein